ncbi:MAG: alpha/beta hydrolase [Verrucomicrobia bacterium]|nr:alpha/beta hydrolase [Verrucomicrobiota bacterium]
MRQSLTWIGLCVMAWAGAAEKAPKVPAGVRMTADLEYASPGGKSMKLDLYLPENPSSKPLPVVMWVHGGGWKGGSKSSCPGTWLVAQGYAVASVEHRFIPDYAWPAQIEDCHAAVRWLRANAAKYGMDGKHIAAWGGSSGGHLVALMGTLDAPSEERVQAVIDWYGPTDLLTMPPNVLSAKRTRADLAKANGALLLGGIVMDQPEKAKAASALYQVSAGDAPFLIMHGDQDTSVPVDQSVRLHEKLKSVGVESSLHIIAGAGHGGKLFEAPAQHKLIEEFLARQLKK